MAKNPAKANLGKQFEQLVNNSNRAYLLLRQALIIKNDAEWKVLFSVRNGYRVPVKAWKPEKGFVDYVGVLKGGQAICFDAKSVKGTRFPLSNVKPHQVKDLKDFTEMGGIAFLLVHFSDTLETFVLPYYTLQAFIDEMKAGGRKSIPYHYFKSSCSEAKCQNSISIDYLSALEKTFSLGR